MSFADHVASAPAFFHMASLTAGREALQEVFFAVKGSTGEEKHSDREDKCDFILNASLRSFCLRSPGLWLQDRDASSPLFIKSSGVCSSTDQLHWAGQKHLNHSK